MFFAFDYAQEWNWRTLEYTGFWTPQGMLRNLLFNGFHPLIPWLAFLLIGMIIGRFDLNTSEVRRRIFWVGLAVALAADGISWLCIHSLPGVVGEAGYERIAAVFGIEPMPPMPLYILSGAGSGIAIIAGSVSIGIRWGSRWLIRALVATGQLALTLYVAHVVIGMGILEALGRLENQTLWFSLLASALFFTASVIFAFSWRSRFDCGPIEMLMRHLTGTRKAEQVSGGNGGQHR
jgi:uncharacterized membrane protein YeiB